MQTGYGADRGRVLGVLAALVALAGAVLLGLGLRGLAAEPDLALGAPAEQVTVETDADGFSLWSADPAAYASTVCTAGGTTLLRPVEPYGVVADGATSYELARSPEGLARGKHEVGCEPVQEFRVGARATATSPGVLGGGTGLLLGAALLALALLLGAAAVVAHLRRRRLESYRVPPHRLAPRSHGVG